MPEGRTCCGQPAWSAGDRRLSVALASKAIAELEGYDYVVVPSGSYTDQIRNVYPQLFADDAQWAIIGVPQSMIENPPPKKEKEE